MTRRTLAAMLLLPIAAATAWWAWRTLPQPVAESAVGPPRGDYTAENYRLVVMNKDGDLSFRAHGPYAARDPWSQELFLNQPRFSFPANDGSGDWLGQAYSGWVSSDGDEVRLKHAVVLDGPKLPDKDPVQFRTEWLSILPDPQTAHTPLPVTISRGASILRGTGMDATLPTSRVQLLSQVSFHDVPVKKR